MSAHTDETILAIFRDLPDHRGCDASELARAESDLEIKFPDYYRELMLFDGHRLMNTGMIIPPMQLSEYNRNAARQGDSDPTEFALPQLVFAVNDIEAEFAMDAVGGADSPVYEVNDFTGDGLPRRIHNSLEPFIATVLRKYLNL